MTDTKPTFIPFARPSIGAEEEAAVIRVLRSGWLTTGSETSAFEREFALRAGARYALAVNSATAGLHLALQSSGVGRGDRVAMSPYTFVATAEAVHRVGAEPLFVDIASNAFTIDTNLLEGALADVKAIIPVHIGGAPCAMGTIMEMARRHDCRVIEDAAHCQPGVGDGYSIGRAGDCAVYSFYATKPITTGEGGMVVTDDAEIARKIGLLRNHGIDREVWHRYRDRDADWRYAVVEDGYKYNLPDLNAAIGRVQLARAERLLARRRAIAAIYDDLLSGCDWLQAPAHAASDARHLYIVTLRHVRLSIGRDQFVQRLQSAGIGVSVHYIPLHHMPHYRSRYGFVDGDFPVATERFENSFSLPIYPSLNDDSAAYVAKMILSIGNSS